MKTIKANLILCSLIFLFISSSLAWGHAFPDHSEPKVGTTVNDSPSLVRIWFDTELEPAFSEVRVENTKGEQVDKGDGQVSSSNSSLLEVTLPKLPPSTYKVIWKAAARDGHTTRGDYTFTVKYLSLRQRVSNQKSIEIR